MYEFLAPWGVLIPLCSAVAVYLLVTEKRRKSMIQAFELPPPNEKPAPSRTASAPLSLVHG